MQSRSSYKSVAELIHRDPIIHRDPTTCDRPKNPQRRNMPCPARSSPLRIEAQRRRNARPAASHFARIALPLATSDPPGPRAPRETLPPQKADPARTPGHRSLCVPIACRRALPRAMAFFPQRTDPGHGLFFIHRMNFPIGVRSGLRLKGVEFTPLGPMKYIDPGKQVGPAR